MKGVLDGLQDTIDVYGLPMFQTILLCEGVEMSDLLRPVEIE